MLIAEDLLLLLLDDETGKTPGMIASVDTGLAGAVLVELALLELVDVADEGESVRRGRLVLRPGNPPAHPVLANALEILRDKEGKKPKDVLSTVAKGLKDRLAGGLIEAGVLRREEHRTLGLFPTTRLPAQDSRHEASVRVRLAEVLDGAQPDQHSAALLALLYSLDAVTKVLDVPDRRAAKKRAKELAKGQWAPAAVRKAIEEIDAAMVAIIAATASGSASG
jgi:hypothetical protein